MTKDILYRIEHHTSRDKVAIEIMAAAREEIMKLRESNRQLLEHADAEDCQECGIGQSEAWKRAKALRDER